MAIDKWTLLWSAVLLLVSSIGGINAAGCGETVYTAPSGTINSPNYPENYDNDLSCTYSIRAPQPSVFALTFQSFSLESGGSGCSNDWVQIQYIIRQSTYTSQKYCGSTPPPPFVISNCNESLILFRTDEANVYGGFSLQYSVTPNGELADCNCSCDEVALIVISTFFAISLVGYIALGVLFWFRR